MLSVQLAHTAPVAPSQLWSAWNWDPVIWVALIGVATVHHRGVRSQVRDGSRPSRRPRVAFGLGLASLAVALVSPLDALSSSLASAHMVQHLLLILVAAPLLVLSAPLPVLLEGLPRPLVRSLRGRRRRRPRAGPGWPPAGHVAVLAAVHVLAVWFWHARAPYDAALEHHVIHALEHVTFLVTALASWSAILTAGTKAAAGGGTAVLVLFALSVQGSLLGALLTFAPSPWYGAYAGTTAVWGLDPLADQQLAGVIMWVPTGLAYLVVALFVLRRWMDLPPPAGPAATSPVGRAVVGDPVPHRSA